MICLCPITATKSGTEVIAMNFVAVMFIVATQFEVFLSVRVASEWLQSGVMVSINNHNPGVFLQFIFSCRSYHMFLKDRPVIEPLK